MSVLNFVLSLFYSYPLLAPFVVLAAVFIVLSLHKIGPTEVGLVTKRFSFKKLTKDNPVAFSGEAGYQADLLMPGLRWKTVLVYSVDKYPWIQVPAGEIGVVIAQVGSPLPIGAKSAVYKKEFANFSDLRNFIQLGGQKGVQRPVLPPGSLVPVHPVGFLIITRSRVYGEPISPELCAKMGRGGELMPASLGLKSEQLELVRIEPQPRAKDGSTLDVVGIVTTYEGDPLPSGDIASRLGGFADVAKMETDNANDAQIIEALLGSKNNLHNNYQDFQSFLDHGGHIGLQHDPLLYGAYALNPFLVSVEMVPMLIIKQGQVVHSGTMKELLSPGDMVEMVAERLPAELDLLLRECGASLESTAQGVRITVTRSRKREIVERLWSAGCDVISMHPLKGSLEDFYIKVVGSGENV